MNSKNTSKNHILLAWVCKYNENKCLRTCENRNSIYKFIIYYSWFNVKIVINDLMESYVLGFYVKSKINIDLGKLWYVKNNKCILPAHYNALGVIYTV